MNLTKEQLEKIQAFIKQKGINYIDVQMEIIDHVASLIEDKMSNNEDLEFDDALIETHKSFGVFGFSSIEEGITKGLNIRYRKIFFRNIIHFFNIKLLPLTLLAFYAFYKVQYLVNDMKLKFPLFITSMLVVIVILYIQFFKSYNLKNYLTFRISASYLSLLGGILSIGIGLRNLFEPGYIYYGINTDYFFTSFFVGVFFLYINSSIKTANIGIVESKLLQEKYNIL